MAKITIITIINYQYVKCKTIIMPVFYAITNTIQDDTVQNSHIYQFLQTNMLAVDNRSADEYSNHALVIVDYNCHV